MILDIVKKPQLPDRRARARSVLGKRHIQKNLANLSKLPPHIIALVCDEQWYGFSLSRP